MHTKQYFFVNWTVLPWDKNGHQASPTYCIALLQFPRLPRRYYKTSISHICINKGMEGVREMNVKTFKTKWLPGLEIPSTRPWHSEKGNIHFLICLPSLVNKSKKTMDSLEPSILIHIDIYDARLKLVYTSSIPIEGFHCPVLAKTNTNFLELHFPF